MIDLAPFAALPDSATVRVVPVGSPLPRDKAAAFQGVVEAVIDQWKERGAIVDGAAAFVAGGRFLLVAWQLAKGDLSGCTKDQLTHMVLDFEKNLGVPLLNAPRFAVELDGDVRFLRMPEFKALRAQGRIHGATRAYDHLVTTLGDVRAGRFATTVDASWYAPVGA